MRLLRQLREGVRILTHDLRATVVWIPVQALSVNRLMPSAAVLCIL